MKKFVLNSRSFQLLTILSLLILTIPGCAADKEENKNAEQKNTQTQAKSEKKEEEKNKPAESEVSAAAAAAEKENENKVVDVYLFHGSYRCHSCNLMEELTLEAIDEHFSKQKKDKTVIFKHINVEKPENRHYIDDYNISAISIILSKKVDGEETQWKNLDKVWILLRNPENFIDYVKKEIQAYL